MTEEDLKAIEKRLQKLERHKTDFKDMHSRTTPLKKKLVLLEAEISRIKLTISKGEAPLVPIKGALNLTIYNIGLSNRSIACLEYKNIRTVSELTSYSSRYLQSIPQLGEKSFNEIKHALNEIGVQLKQ